MKVHLSLHNRLVSALLITQSYQELASIKKIASTSSDEAAVMIFSFI